MKTIHALLALCFPAWLGDLDGALIIVSPIILYAVLR